MASKRHVTVGGVQIGGGAPVAVQTMTKTETADFDATMRQIHAIAEAGGDLVRCAVPRDDDVRWLAMVLRRVAVLIVREVERRYDMPSSFAEKR